MFNVKLKTKDFLRDMELRARNMRNRHSDAFKATVAEVGRTAKDAAPVGKWFGGGLRRSMTIDLDGTGGVLRGTVAFSTPYAMMVHENYDGFTIKPRKKYLYIPLTRKGAKAGMTHDYTGVRRSRGRDDKNGDYLLTTKPVRIPPQPKAGFLYQKAEQFWQWFDRNLKRIKA